MTDFEIWCGIVVVLLGIYYYYLVKNYDFWKKRGVPGPKPIPLFGNFMSVMVGQTFMGTYIRDLYEQYKHEPFVGAFLKRQPVLIIHDPDLIKTVLIKDFSTFSSRGISFNEVAEPLSQHLFALEPKRWRPLRARLTPVFTSGKLKEMFSLILECSNTLEKYLDTLVAKGEPIECRELAAKYTTDVIGSCAFGINMATMSEEGSKFREIGKNTFKSGFKEVVKARIREGMPWLYTLIGYVTKQDDLTEYFMKAVLDVMDYRKRNNIVKHDFIKTLIDIQAHPEKMSDIELTETLLVAQAFVFFAAGFETSSGAISNALYELAQNHELQDKLREEIKEHYLLNNGIWQYENLKKLKYLDAVFKETLRKYPALPILMRKSVEDYTFEDAKFSIPKDTKVFIPVYAFHYDPDIFSDPEVFDINRFIDDTVAIKHPMHYLPFGDGPRNCIGARFAVFQSKIGLIKILRNYKVDVCEQTQIPYQLHSAAFLVTPKHGITLKVTKVES